MNARKVQTDVEVPLLPGETIDELKHEETPPAGDAELNKRYVREGVRIVVEQARYPLSQILGMFTETFETDSGHTEPKYKRDPEYQRRHRWDNVRKSRLIESFLMNVPVPPVFLYEYDLARFEVMDGRQRLTALMDFYQNKFELTGLQHWPELHGRTYSTLPNSIRDGIDRRYLSSIILLNETAATEEKAAFLKKLVFERLNSGGVRLSGQETRNAVYDGPLNDLCLRLSQTPELRIMLGTPGDLDPLPPREESTAGDVEDDDSQEATPAREDSEGVRVTSTGRKMFESMEDVELVLRFFAYRHLDKFSQGLNKIAEFLDEFLVRGNKFPAETLKSYEEIFLSSLRFWYKIGGTDAFKGASNRQFSKIAFDALMYASSALTEAQKELLLSNQESVRLALTDMYSKHGVDFGGRKTNTSDARRRNKHAMDALNAALKSSGTR